MVSLITATYQAKDHNGQQRQQSINETAEQGNKASLHRMDFPPLQGRVLS